MGKIFSYVAIPSIDFNRAVSFYSDILGRPIKPNPGVPFPMAYILDDEEKNVGHLFQLPNFKPSSDGPIVYFELARDLNDTLGQIVKAGGKIIMPKTSLGPSRGFWAMFLDTEGNRLALHSIE